jgi:serine/threonine protein kinase
LGGQDPLVEEEEFSGFADLEGDVWGDWRLERSQVTMIKVIGEGEYGEVYEGRLRGTGEYDGFIAKVAVKKLKKAEKLEEFFKEAKVMMNLRHAHLVNFYGVVVEDEPHLIVSELCEHGCLKDYLKTAVGKQTTVPEMNKLIYEICGGMAHLEQEGYVHRDLAARNVLLDGSMEAKVADFGMSRSVAEGVYKAGEDAVCPIRWTAPEAMHFGTFSIKSDVWSFGITACEVLAHGEDPYNGIPNMHVIRLLEGGSRMNQLSNCTDDLYELLLDSWEEKAEDRPTFAVLLPQLKAIAGL